MADMKLSFWGAAGEVTGSCYLLETGRARVLIDFGLHQGGPSAEVRNRRFPPLDAARLDAVILTHAHLDHSGRLPLLIGEGFRGRIFCTAATAELACLTLEDSGHIQESEAERFRRGRQRCGRELCIVSPLYTLRDVEAVRPLMSPVAFESPREVAEGVTVRFVEAGHILGSASLEVTVEGKNNGGVRRVLAFSGDLGPRGVPLLRDPRPLTEADHVVLESTYGDRDHRSLDDTVEEMAQILESVQRAGGKALVPAFAIGRTQQLIYHLGELRRAGRLDHMPVYVDSPMAVETTELYRRHRELFDPPALRIIENGDSPLNFPGLTFTRTAEESKRLNYLGGGVGGSGSGAVIIAASGMCTGGRILHHFKHGLWRKGVHVIIVGFQSRGSLGRRLVEGARRVRVLGEWIAVNAKIHTLGGLSAHAGRTELLEWGGNFRGVRPRMILTHGEDAPRAALRDGLRQRTGIDAAMPQFGETMPL
ncbi:MAG: MBL fold metallo-hydrolase [Phycisphaerales bacterium]|nr:MBL fold metallo-hydrolase [Phycisphaerales bacterium]